MAQTASFQEVKTTLTHCPFCETHLVEFQLETKILLKCRDAFCKQGFKIGKNQTWPTTRYGMGKYNAEVPFVSTYQQKR